MVEKLFNAITEKSYHLVELMNLFGKDYWLVNKEVLVINGMKDAFEIIAGHSYAEHLLSKINAA